MESVYNFLLYFTGWPLAFVLLAGGIYFTVRTGLVQCGVQYAGIIQSAEFF